MTDRTLGTLEHMIKGKKKLSETLRKEEKIISKGPDIIKFPDGTELSKSHLLKLIDDKSRELKEDLDNLKSFEEDKRRGFRGSYEEFLKIKENKQKSKPWKPMTRVIPYRPSRRFRRR